MDQLDAQQRWEIIGLLWDSLPEDAVIEPPPWHIEELEKRIAAADQNPTAGEAWESVFERLSRKS